MSDDPLCIRLGNSCDKKEEGICMQVSIKEKILQKFLEKKVQTDWGGVKVVEGWWKGGGGGGTYQVASLPFLSVLFDKQKFEFNSRTDRHKSSPVAQC